MTQIEYSGLKLLSTEEQVELKNIVEQEATKIEKTTLKLQDLQVDIKTHNTKGERRRYLLSVRAKTGKERFTVRTKENDPKKSTAWDINSATRKAMLELQNEVRHRLGTERGNLKRSRLRELLARIRGE